MERGSQMYDDRQEGQVGCDRSHVLLQCEGVQGGLREMKEMCSLPPIS